MSDRIRPLAIVGNVNVDLILGPAEPWPTPGTEIIVDYDELRVGGSAGNSALAWMGLGVDFQIAANVGSDQYGVWLRDAFGERAANWPAEAGNTTLTVGITHPDGERTFFTTRGHLPHFDWPEVEVVIDAERLRGGILLLCGSFLTDALTKSYDRLFDWADAHQISVALDTGWPLDGWTDANRNAVLDWLKRCRCVLFNEVEATVMTGIEDPLEAARHIKTLMPSSACVVVKRGPDGALAIGPEGNEASVAAPRVVVADTIGAGDVFNSAFLASYALGQTLEDCLSAAVKVASHAISTTPRSYGGREILAKTEPSAA